MGLTESKGNMYTWVTHTWNTVKGECPHGCTYCYMKRYGKQKPVHFDEKELNTDLGSGNFIFVGSSCDIFANEIPDEWILKTLEYCNKFDNEYLFQSKNPINFINYFDYFPPKSKFCTTIETNRIYPQMGNTPPPIVRANAMSRISEFDTYVTIEPIMDFDIIDMIELIRICHPVQVNIGSDSGHNNLPEPTKEKLLTLIKELQGFTVVDRKTNLQRLLK